jgi:hypothetical protein
MTTGELQKRIYWTAASISAVYIAVIFVFLKGLIPPRFLGWIFIAIAIAGGVTFHRLFKRFRDELRAAREFEKPLDDATRRRYRSSIRNMKILVGVLVFALVYGLWSTRGDPVLPRIVGVSVNILLNASLISSIRKLQRKLR